MAFKKFKKTASTSEHYDIYTEYSKVLRTWLVAYGVGVPALILSQKDLWQRLATSGQIQLIVILFIVGVTVQVMLAIVNKSIMWISYYGNINPRFKSSKWHSLSITIAKYYFIDFIIDIISIGTYAVASYYCFQSLKY